MESPVLLLFQVGAPPIGYGTPGTVPVPMQTVRRENVGKTQLDEVGAVEMETSFLMIFG